MTSNPDIANFLLLQYVFNNTLSHSKPIQIPNLACDTVPDRTYSMLFREISVTKFLNNNYNTRFS